MFKCFKNKKGFTLIELIIVIAIIGILAAVALPRFASIRENARIDADRMTARNLCAMAEVYVSEQQITDATKVTLANIAYLLSDTSPTSQVTGKDFSIGATKTGHEFVYTVTADTATVFVSNVETPPFGGTGDFVKSTEATP